LAFSIKDFYKRWLVKAKLIKSHAVVWLFLYVWYKDIFILILKISNYACWM
jgi:hypothetical protein